MSVEILEIIKPSDQGMTVPYVCRGEDGHLYFVKGRNAHCNSWWSEWICAHAGRTFGLNIPPFELVNVSEELLAEADSGWRQLGAGVWFGSRQHPLASWCEVASAHSADARERADVAVFDWWIQNLDRTDGNTNMLWDSTQRRLVVIDHNQAFDRDFDSGTFLGSHIYARDFRAVLADAVARVAYEDRLTAAYAAACAACDNAPADWHWSNAEHDVPCKFDSARALELLRRCFTEELWSLN